jgi:glycosyltransferase involved in cell wall biosynthesis
MITVGIKALNEERHIAASIESALAAVAPFAGHVVLADSGSTDKTIEIASAYPITIVQLSNISERCCGAGAQLAFQYSKGNYFYLLDGDMVMHTNFIATGIQLLEGNSNIAAVGGAILEQNIDNQDFEIRASKAAKVLDGKLRYVDRLDCGGLYRVSAINSVQYFADQNLHSFEEFELGARLKTKGWKLVRITEPAINHYGHTSGGYKLLWNRFKSGYAGGAGEVLKSAIGKPQIFNVLSRLSHIPLAFVVVGWWVLVIALFMHSLYASIAAMTCPLAFLTLRRKSFRLGMYSLASWNLNAVATILALFKSRVSPEKKLKAKILREAFQNHEKKLTTDKILINYKAVK